MAAQPRLLVLLTLLSLSAVAWSQSYEDKRCKCVCPSPSAVLNSTLSSRSLQKRYIVNVPPNECNCVGVILPSIGEELKGKEQEYCPRCECKFESRNTSIIKYVVIIVIWVVMLLVVYMGFLICLDPLINKRANTSYQEHTNEEDEGSVSPGGSAHPMGIRGNMLNRQDKWKQQVREQRRNIYDRHTMLN